MGKERVVRTLGYLTALVCWLFLPAIAVHAAATFTVNSPLDEIDANPGDGICATSGGACTLRAAIMEANHLGSGPHTIILPAGTYTLAIPTSASDNEAIGDLDITASMDIVGAGSSSTIIDGNRDITSDGVIEITGITVNISDVTIRNGDLGILSFSDLTLTNSVVSGNNEGGVFSNGSGAKLTLINSTVSGNSSLGGAGGINHGGTGGLTIINSTVSGNSSTGCCNIATAGGILLRNAATLTMINSTVSNNRATIGAGVSSLSGGIQIDTTSQSSVIIESTIDGNSVAGTGGGILLTSGRVTLINSTVSDNSASTSGGGIHNTSTTGAVDIFNSTITGNTAGTKAAAGIGGGVFTGAMSTTTFQNTILADNRAFIQSFPKTDLPTLQFNDCAGTIDSDGHNLMRVQSCTVTGDAPIVADPQLGLLTFNGGPTKTHALLNGSPAIDTGDCELGPKVRTDQRGFRRPVDGDQNGTFTCDIGAVEFGSDGTSDIGVYHNGGWALDLNGNDQWDGCGVDGCAGFGGVAGDLPVVGDWTGTGTAKIGVFRNGGWALDHNGNDQFDGCGVDGCFGFGGVPGDLPVVGDWSGSGTTKVGVFRDGNWALDLNGNRQWDGCAIDRCYSFGQAGDTPIVGDWTGTGTAKVGVFRNGGWALDLNGNGQWDGCGVDGCFGFGGVPGDLPVVGDWSGSGTTKLGVFRDGNWALDLNGNGQWDGCGTDGCVSFGLPGVTPLAGSW